MKLALLARSSVLVLVAPAILSLAAEAQSLPGGQHREAALSVAGIAGFGRGTLVMPGIADGHLRVQLVDDDANPRFELDATLIPYAFLLEHTPAGAIEGLVSASVDPDSGVEAEPIAAVRGEWSVDEYGNGRLVAELRSLDEDPALAPLGVLVGSFRLPPPPATIAPPLYAPLPTVIEASRVAGLGGAVQSAGSHVARRGAPASSAHAPADGLAERSSGPTIIVDWIPPPQVARVTVRWAMYD